VDCDLLTLCTGTRHPADMWAYHPENQSPEAWNDMVDALRQVCRIASGYGLRTAIEPETANVVCDARAAERVFEELGPDAGSLSIILDAANLYRPCATSGGLFLRSLQNAGRRQTRARITESLMMQSPGWESTSA